MRRWDLIVAVALFTVGVTVLLAVIGLALNSGPRGWVLDKNPDTHELKIGFAQRTRWISVSDGPYYMCQVGQFYPTCGS